MAIFQFKLRDLVPACLAVALAVAIIHPACAAAPDSLTPQARADFEWFGTLGFPDLKGCPYVRVATGSWWWNQASEDPPREHVFKAFLLATNADGFRVFTVDLAENRFSLTNLITQGSTRPAFQVLQLTNEVAALLGAFTNPPPREDEDRLFGSLLRRQSEVFTLAWACWRDSLDADAQRLYEQAQKMRSRSGGLGGMTHLRATLEQDLGMDMFYGGLASFGAADISRPQLLAQFESIVTNYPLSEYAEKSKPIISVLKRMVAEDEAHAKLALTNLDALSVEQRVRELIFRLRDQNGYQSSQPGECNVFDDFHGATNTPAHQLLKLGYAAVPQLIAALDDPSYSRSVGVGPAWVPGDVLTVGDCALQILEAISGRNFFHSRVAPYLSTSSNKELQKYDAMFNQMNGGTNNLPPNDDLASTRKAAQSWWAEVQKKGGKQVLADAVISAGQDAPAQAEMLCQRYPDIAAATIIRGVQAATNWWVHARLVEIVSKLDEPQVNDFLSREMSSAPSSDDRERAAYYLRDKRPAEALQAMLHDWETNGEGATVSFLADSDSVPAIQALQRNLRQHPISIRSSVIRDIGETNAWTWGGRNKYSPATLDAIEECLATELDDTEETMNFIPAQQRFEERPRPCDMAANYLSQRWPDRYVFNASLGLNSRNRQRVECQNVWRLAHNLPALPFPPTPNQLKPDQANTVTAIQWAEDSAKPGADFAARVEAFRDKLLDTNKLVPFLAALGTHPEPQLAGIMFKAVKDEDLTGVRFTISLLSGTPPEPGRQSWVFGRSVTLDRKALNGIFGRDLAGQYSTAGAAVEFADAIAKALAADPGTPFEIKLQLEYPQNDK